MNTETTKFRSNYNKASVQAIVINEGILYAVRFFMDEEEISKKEKNLREYWGLCHEMWKRLDAMVDRDYTTKATKGLFEMEGAEDVVLLYKNERFQDVLMHDPYIVTVIEEIRRLSDLICKELGMDFIGMLNDAQHFGNVKK